MLNCCQQKCAQLTLSEPVCTPEGSHSLTTLSAPPVATTVPLLQAPLIYLTAGYDTVMPCHWYPNGASATDSRPH